MKAVVTLLGPPPWIVKTSRTFVCSSSVCWLARPVAARCPVTVHSPDTGHKQQWPSRSSALSSHPAAAWRRDAWHGGQLVVSCDSLPGSSWAGARCLQAAASVYTVNTIGNLSPDTRHTAQNSPPRKASKWGKYECLTSSPSPLLLSAQHTSQCLHWRYKSTLDLPSDQHRT